MHWDIRQETDDTVLRELTEKFMILYLICLYGDFEETLRNQQLEHLKGALLNSQVTNQVWKKQSRMQRKTGDQAQDVKMIYFYSSCLLLFYVCVSFTLFLSFFLEVNSEQYIYVLKYAKKPPKTSGKNPNSFFLEVNSEQYICIYVYCSELKSRI